ncbi:MAG: ATP-dependent dethiobiotin synthetase BioD [Alphaproteobacteria bacterium]|nr:ATP-dependent dethiobiotin synthetase BioD [Alphaproteobacteria bacterium]
MKLVVTGTDTDVGKTVFAAALAGALKARYWKPVQAGAEPETDSQTVVRLAGVETFPEAYKFKLAASPHQAAAAEAIAIDTDALTPPTAEPLVIEGAGGLMVPLTRTTLNIDVFARWGFPLVLCARTALGTINHTLLSVEAIGARNIPLLGITFIGNENRESESIIIEKSGAHRLGRLPRVDPLNRESLAAAFAANFRKEDFI